MEVIRLNTEMKGLQSDGVFQLSIPHLISKHGFASTEGSGEGQDGLLEE